MPTSSSRSPLFSVAIWEALATESRRRPVAPPGEQRVAGRPCEGRVAREQAHHDGVDAAGVHVVALEDQDGMAIAGFGAASGSARSAHQIWPRCITGASAGRCREPACFAAAGRARRGHHPAGRPWRSPRSTPRLHRRELAAGRGTERAASASRRLRETFSRREQRSIWWKSSSGIEIAVFMGRV